MKSRATMRVADALGSACLVAILSASVPAGATPSTRAVGEEPYVEAGWLGIWVRPIAPDLRTEAGAEGLTVVGTMPLSPGDRAGLRPGDLLLEFDHQPCDDADRFLASVGVRRPGERVRLTIRRGERTMPLVASLGRACGPLLAPLPLAGNGTPAGSTPWDDRRMRLGVQVIGLTETLAPYFKAKTREGVLVTHVDENGPAARAGLLAGDVIRSFADRKVRSPAELRDALGQAGAGKHEVRILRRGQQRKVRMTLAEPVLGDPAGDVAIFLSPRDRERLRRGLVAGDPEAWRELARLRGEVEGLRATLRAYEREARRGPAGAGAQP